MNESICEVINDDNIEEILFLFINKLKEIEKLNKLKNILNKCSNKVIEKLNEETKQNIIQLTEINEEDNIFSLNNSQFLEPKGKFNVIFKEDCLILNNTTSGSFIIEWKIINHIILLPSPNTSTKDGNNLLFFILKTPILLKTKKQSIFCWQLNNSGTNYSTQYGPVHFNGKENEVVSGLTEALFGHPLCRPNKTLFQTSTGSSFLRCYKGVQEGTLFPLEQGILFSKPSIFIASNDVGSIEAGRGGSALTRYIDLKIETNDDKKYEFSNIDREELPAIQQYVQYYIEKRKKDDKKRKQNIIEVDIKDDDDNDEQEDSDSDGSDDEDFNPNQSSSDEGGEDDNNGSDDDEHSDDYDDEDSNDSNDDDDDDSGSEYEKEKKSKSKSNSKSKSVPSKLKKSTPPKKVQKQEPVVDLTSNKKKPQPKKSRLS